MLTQYVRRNCNENLKAMEYAIAGPGGPFLGPSLSENSITNISLTYSSWLSLEYNKDSPYI